MHFFFAQNHEDSHNESKRRPLSPLSVNTTKLSHHQQHPNRSQHSSGIYAKSTHPSIQHDSSTNPPSSLHHPHHPNHRTLLPNHQSQLSGSGSYQGGDSFYIDGHSQIDNSQHFENRPPVVPRLQLSKLLDSDQFCATPINPMNMQGSGGPPKPQFVTPEGYGGDVGATPVYGNDTTLGLQHKSLYQTQVCI